MTKKILTTIGLSLAIVMTIGLMAYAETKPPIDPTLRPENAPFDIGEEVQSKGATSGTVLILNILAGGLLYFAAPIAIFMIVLGGIDFVLGGAESEKVEQGKKNMTWAIIGLILIILSYAIVKSFITFILSAANTVS